MKAGPLVLVLLAAAAGPVRAEELVVPMVLLEQAGPGKPIGSVRIVQTQYGLVFTPDLRGMAAGPHGFHVHEKGSCKPSAANGHAVLGGDAGGHYNPTNAKHHGAPWGDGHLGDLPVLYVSAGGTATHPVLAPRLKLADVKGRSLMIHDEHDDHAGHPGGSRMACGVIPR